jgi:membrane protein
MIARLRALNGRFDRFQRRHTALAVPLAVRQKYAEDQAGYLAASIACYAFLSVFPLLLLLATGLGYALRSDHGLQTRVLHSVVVEFPVIGPQLQRNIHSLRGSGLALVIGIAGTLWAGTRVSVAAENAMNHLWDVPFKDRPNPFRALARASVMIVLFWLASIGATLLADLAGLSGSLPVRAAGLALSLAVNFVLFWSAFRVLTVRDIAWRELWIGAVVAAVLWAVLQSLGGYYIAHELRGASATYGFFGIVLGLMTWLYLGAHVTLLAAETNVVLKRRLWPRSFSPIVEEPLTSADQRALASQASVEERRRDEQVHASFGEPAEPD